MDALRIASQGSCLISQQVREAGRADRLQGCLVGRCWIESNGCGSYRLRYRPFEGGVAAFGLAARLDAQRRRREQIERDVEQRAGVAALELEFDLADRRSRRTGEATNLALVDRRLDVQRRGRIEIVVRMTAVANNGWRPPAIPLGRQPPLWGACRSGSPATISSSHYPCFGRATGFDGLHEPPLRRAHAQAQSLPAQHPIDGIVIGRGQGRPAAC